MQHSLTFKELETSQLANRFKIVCLAVVKHSLGDNGQYEAAE